MINLNINGNDELSYLKDYIIELDRWDIQILDERLEKYSIEELLEQQLTYLDCSRIIDGMRMMQTIGYPYRAEITKYVYFLNNVNNFDANHWIHKLLDLHASNLAFEQENPPVWYGGKKAKNAFEKKYNKNGTKKESKTKKAKITKEAKIRNNLKLKLLGSCLTDFKLNNEKS